MIESIHRLNINFSTILGVLLGFILIVFSIYFSADNPAKFFNFPGLLIVVGGVIAATFISYPWPELKKVFRSFSNIWKYDKTN